MQPEPASRRATWAQRRAEQDTELGPRKAQADLGPGARGQVKGMLGYGPLLGVHIKGGIDIDVDIDTDS